LTAAWCLWQGIGTAADIIHCNFPQQRSQYLFHNELCFTAWISFKF